MKRLGAALCLLLALALLPGAALAAYESGSSLEADAPVTLKGRSDALVNKGLVSFVGDADNLLLSLKGFEMQVRVVTVPASCPGTPGVPACAPEAVTGSRPVEQTHELTDATLTVTKTLGAFKAVALNDPSAYGGSASAMGTPGPLATTTSDGASFTSFSKARYLSPYQADWSEQAPANALTEDVYTAEPRVGVVNATSGGSARGLGGLQVMLQGLSVRVTGRTEDGKDFDQTFDLSSPRRSSDAWMYLDAQTPNGILSAASRAPLVAHGVSVADAVGGATLPSATGKIVSDGREQAVEDTDTTLAGPLSLTLSKVVDGAPMRLAFGISDDLRIAGNLPPPEEDESDTRALVAAGAAGAGAAGLLAGLAWFWPRLKLGATLLLIPLYSRIERTAVLDHEKRDEIYGLIRATPGIHAHEIGSKAHIGWGTTVYHLKLLEQHNLIVSQKSGRYKRFFVNTGEFTKKKDVYGALRNDTAKAVAQHIVEHPGVTQKELCAALGIQPSLASWHVEKLEGVDLVKRVKDGRQVRYFAGPAWSQLNVRVDPTGGADGVAET